MLPFSVTTQTGKLTDVLLGQSYPPEFFSYVKDAKVRSNLERIAIETEEDYQSICRILDDFGVRYYRPEFIFESWEQYVDPTDNLIRHPPMYPCDTTCMIGTKFFTSQKDYWKDISTDSRPFCTLTPKEKMDLVNRGVDPFWQSAYDLISERGNEIVGGVRLISAMVNRIDSGIIRGVYPEGSAKDIIDDVMALMQNIKPHLPNLDIQIIPYFGDASVSIIAPNTIVTSLPEDMISNQLRDWAVYYLPSDLYLLDEFRNNKPRLRNMWRDPSLDLSGEFSDYLELWLNKTQYIEPFDTNLLVLDEKNVLVNRYDEKAFAIMAECGITPHISRIRHRYYWDGGHHCFTSDLNRE